MQPTFEFYQIWFSIFLYPRFTLKILGSFTIYTLGLIFIYVKVIINLGSTNPDATQTLSDDPDKQCNW
jgi:hypothetical protein